MPVGSDQLRSSVADQLFDLLDRNKDGVITSNELNPALFATGTGGVPSPPAPPLAMVSSPPPPPPVRECVSQSIQVIQAAQTVMHLADRHARNGRLTMSEMQAFLRGTPYEGFMKWLTSSGQWYLHDVDSSGTIEISELESALADYYSQGEGHGVVAGGGCGMAGFPLASGAALPQQQQQQQPSTPRQPPVPMPVPSRREAREASPASLQRESWQGKSDPLPFVSYTGPPSSSQAPVPGRTSMHAKPPQKGLRWQTATAPKWPAAHPRLES